MNTRALKLLFAATVCMLIGSSVGSKFVSVQAERNSLADQEFSFSFKHDARVVNAPGIRIENFSAPRHRLLGMRDVDVSITRIIQQPGRVIDWHVHPRGSENYATLSGHLQVSMLLEGAVNPRLIVSKLPPAHVFSIPQGYMHTAKCISDKPCVYHVFFNSADPGFANAPKRA